MRYLAILSAASLLLGHAAVQSRADIILDMDPSTLGVFESSVAVPSGTTVVIKAFYFPPIVGGPLTFDGVALDMGYDFTGAGGTPADTATAAFVDVKAGPLAGLGAPSMNVVGPGAVAGGSSLTTGTLPAVFPGTMNVGGAGYFDLDASFFGGLPDLQLPQRLI